ncbi:MAG: hypothetical protein ACRD3E_02185 [Terriglobales bacterium]
MKAFVVLILALSSAITAAGQARLSDNDLPVLHRIQTVTLSPSYSCRSKADFQKGYEATALFLTAEEKRRNGPSLLFDGACGSPDFFEVNTGGDDIGVITDYGDVRLEDMAATQVFSPKKRTDSVSTFTYTTKVVAGHTYGVLLNRSDSRGFFYFRVLEYLPNERVKLEYAVMDYQRLRVEAASAGFDWKKAPAR